MTVSFHENISCHKKRRAAKTNTYGASVITQMIWASKQHKRADKDLDAVLVRTSWQDYSYNSQPSDVHGQLFASGTLSAATP